MWPRVVKMVPNTQCYMAYNVISCNQIKKNTREIQIADFTMYIRLPSPKMTANSLKTYHLIAICSILLYIGIAYIRWYLVSPHVQVAQNMYAKRGKGVFEVELRAAKGGPSFKRKTPTVLLTDHIWSHSTNFG